MGGTQRVAERAGAGRAREFVMSGDLYDAATLERWGVMTACCRTRSSRSTRSSSPAAWRPGLAEGPGKATFEGR
jgi:enoyl-CoA hydratase